MATTGVLASRVSQLRALPPEAEVALGVVAVFAMLALLASLLRSRPPHRGRRRRQTEVEAQPASAVAVPDHVLLIGSFLADAKRDFHDVQNGRTALGAVMLHEETGLPVVADALPRYFTGPFDARLVLVHAMPRLDELEPHRYRDFGDYISQHASCHDRAERAPRVISFLEPFSTTPIENGPRTTDSTLELYFIPYACRPFASRKLKGRLFRHEYDRLMEVITAYPRDYVIFCGAAFERLLGPHMLDRTDHEFRLPVRAGLSKSEYRFSVVDLRSRGRIVPVAIAQSFAMRTTPMGAYGRACQQRYLNAQPPGHKNATG